MQPKVDFGSIRQRLKGPPPWFLNQMEYHEFMKRSIITDAEFTLIDPPTEKLPINGPTTVPPDASGGMG